MDVALKREIDGIGFTQEEIEALQEAYSFYVTDTVPAGTYEEVAWEKYVPAISAVLVVRDDMDEDLVYNLTKILFEYCDELTNAKKTYSSAENAVLGIRSRLRMRMWGSPSEVSITAHCAALTDVIGIVLVGSVVIWQYLQMKRKTTLSNP